MKRTLSSGAVYRIIDVNLNRAREGLKVVEDTVRLARDSRSGFKRVRRLRHRIDEASMGLYRRRISARESSHDVGRSARAGRFRSINELVQANMKRAQEALRVLEEYARLVKPGLARRFQKLRFESYTVEKLLNA